MLTNKPYYSAFPVKEKKQFLKHISKKNEEDDDEENGKKIDLSKIVGFGGSSGHGVSRHKNHIYFYDDVCTESCLELNKELVHLAKDLQFYSLEHDCEPAKIYLHINSYGGELLACFSSVDYIKNSPVPVVTIIEGCAASAATLMSVVAKERYMTPNSWMLIHQLRGGYWGKYDEMEEDLGNSKKFMEKIYDIYEQHTKLDRKTLKKMLKHDEWWNYDTCVKYGLVEGTINNWNPPPVGLKLDKKDKKKDKKSEKKKEKNKVKKGGIKKADKSKKINGVITRAMSKLGMNKF